jgi:hypothetical protein
MADRETPPWRGILAILCAIGAGMSGSVPLSVYELSPATYIPPMVFTTIGIAFAWRAIISGTRRDRLVGLPVFVSLALLLVFIIRDRMQYLI